MVPRRSVSMQNLPRAWPSEVVDASRPESRDFDIRRVFTASYSDPMAPFALDSVARRAASRGSLDGRAASRGNLDGLKPKTDIHAATLPPLSPIGRRQPSTMWLVMRQEHKEQLLLAEQANEALDSARARAEEHMRWLKQGVEESNSREAAVREQLDHERREREALEARVAALKDSVALQKSQPLLGRAAALGQPEEANQGATLRADLGRASLGAALSPPRGHRPSPPRSKTKGAGAALARGRESRGSAFNVKTHQLESPSPSVLRFYFLDAFLLRQLFTDGVSMLRLQPCPRFSDWPCSCS